MALTPRPGLVVRYDYLWADEREKGYVGDAKDRPCSIADELRERSLRTVPRRPE